ncbi:MAG: hypothetical protein Kow0059_00300 [Candidatus Sumerlaeia bacterium]
MPRSLTTSFRRRRGLPPDAAGAALLAVLLALVFHDVLFLGRTFQTAASEGVASIVGDMPWGYPGSRILNQDIPVQDPASSAYNEELLPFAVHAAVRAGCLPLWNPWVACGTPLAAHPIASVYYPLAWITHLWPGSWSWDFFLLLRLWIAGLFTYLFLRQWRVNWGAALTGGALFMLSGYMTRYVNLFHLNVECLVPAAFWAVERLRRAPSAGRFAVLTAIVFIAVLGGNPQSHVMLFATLVAYGGFTWAWQGGRRLGWMRRLTGAVAGAGVVAGGFALAALLAAFFLLPFIEFYLHSVHPHPEHAGTEYLAIYQTITLLSPRFYFPVYMRYLNFPMMPMGVGATFLCVFSVGRFRRRRALAFFLLAAIALIYCKVTGFWFVNWIGRLPLLRVMSFPKYCSEMFFFIAAAAALGLHNLLRNEAHRWWTRLGLALYVAALVSLYERNLYKFLDPYNQTPIQMEFIRVVARFAALAVPAALGLWLMAHRRRRALRPWPGAPPLRRAAGVLCAAVGLLALAELISFQDGQRALRYDTLTLPPVLERLRRDQLVRRPWDRVYGAKTILFPQTAAALQIQDIRDFSPLCETRYWTFMKSFLTNPAIPTYYHPFFNKMFTGSAYQEVVFSPYFDMLGVRYMLTDTYLNIPNFHEHLVNEGRLWGADGAEVLRGFRYDYFYISMDSPSWLELRVDVPPTGDTLQLDPVIDDKEFQRLGGGVVYRVFVEDETGTRWKIFEHLENPHISPEDRIYQTRSIPLDPWAGQTVTLTFQVEGDVRNHNSIKCLWRNLYLTSWEKRVRSNFTLIADGELKVYENREAFERAWVASVGALAAGPEDALKFLQFRRFNPRSEVVLEYSGGDDPRLAALLDSGQFRLFDNPRDALRRFELRPAAAPPRSTAGFDQAAGTARITQYRNDRVIVEAELAQPGFLVLSDTFYPGWRASVNGQPVSMFRANGFLRAVPLPAGRHSVEFRYVPDSFYQGAALAALTMIGCAAAWITQRLRRRRQNAQAALTSPARRLSEETVPAPATEFN